MLKTAVFIALAILCKTSNGSNVKDLCRLNGELGSCELLKDCERAKHDLNFNKILFTRCPKPYRGGLNPIVCCLPNIDPPIPPELIHLPINERKCREYFRKAKSSFAGPLSRNSIFQPIEKCVTGTPIIAGGEEAEEKEFPHMAVIGYLQQENGNEYAYRCGGSLVSDLFVLSAAHCNGADYDEIPRVALFGVLKLSDARNRQTRQISDIIYNDENGYDHTRKRHDIILFKLNSSVIFNHYVIPICLPSVDLEIGTQFLASGWGKTDTTTLGNDHLLKVLLVSINDNNKCSGRTTYFDKSIQICAGSNTSFKDTCNGDSGGPLTIKHWDNTTCLLTIAGIASYGDSCISRTVTRSVFTRVSAYTKWIERQIWNETCIIRP